jgi:hypothetical protein
MPKEMKAEEIVLLHRTVKRYKARKPDDEDLLKEDIIRLASRKIRLSQNNGDVEI